MLPRTLATTDILDSNIPPTDLPTFTSKHSNSEWRKSRILIATITIVVMCWRTSEGLSLPAFGNYFFCWPQQNEIHMKKKNVEQHALPESEDRNHDMIVSSLLVTTSGNNNSNKNLRFATPKSWCNQQNLITQTIYVWYIHLCIYWLIFEENVGKYISIQSNTWMLQCIIHMSNSYCRYQPPKKSQRRHLTCYATSSGLAIEMASVPNIFQVFQGRSQLNQQQVARRDGLRNPTS